MILLSPREDINDPPGRIEKRLTAVQARHTCRMLSRALVRDKPFNPNEEHMGSTTFGNVNPATMTGLAMPPNIKINRAGFGRVKVIVAPS
jgi:hypothetical protein